MLPQQIYHYCKKCGASRFWEKHLNIKSQTLIEVNVRSLSQLRNFNQDIDTIEMPEPLHKNGCDGAMLSEPGHIFGTSPEKKFNNNEHW